MKSELEQMMKCDMCYDRTSAGKRPMCATVCPSQALAYVPLEAIRERKEKPTNVFYFGNERVVTKTFVMVPPDADTLRVDITDFMWESGT